MITPEGNFNVVCPSVEKLDIFVLSGLQFFSKKTFLHIIVWLKRGSVLWVQRCSSRSRHHLDVGHHLSTSDASMD
jgi:hypothetical protein